MSLPQKKIIVLDTETTGLPENGNGFGKLYAPWDCTKYRNARLVQVAYAVYDVNGQLVKEVSTYIRPTDFVISPESTKIHGITQEFAKTYGKSVIGVLRELEAELRDALLVVGHNVSFDRAIIQSEAWRNSMSEMAIMMDQIPCACTMRASIERCSIMKNGAIKWPRLEELHMTLFGETFNGAHNAMEDVRATARCWLVLRKEGYML
jgi:DNA polymerase-3 subunit epsilon